MATNDLLKKARRLEAEASKQTGVPIGTKTYVPKTTARPQSTNYETARKNLETGGLTGPTLEMAQKSLATKHGKSYEPGVVTTENAVDEVAKAMEKEEKLTAPYKEEPKKEEVPTEGTTTKQMLDFLKSTGGTIPAEFTPEAQAMKKEVNDMISMLSSFRTSDAELKAQLKGIETDYSARIERMNDINARREKTFETLGFRTGGRYTGGVRGGVFGGVISEEERQAAMRINELEAAKQAEMLAAKQAKENRDWTVHTASIDAAEALYKQQIDEVTKLNKAYIDKQNEIAKQEKELNELNRNVTLDNAISDLVSQGITDPGDILDMLNYSEAGELVGDVTLKEVSDTIELLQNASGLKGASTDIRDFKLFYPDVNLGTPEGYNKFLRFKAQTAAAGRKPETEPTVGITSEDERTFTGAGFSASEISDVTKAVNEFGVNSVLDDPELSEDQKAAIKKVYNIPEKETVTPEQIDNVVTQKYAQDYLKSVYTAEEIRDLVKEKGFAHWYTGKEGELEKFLNSDDARSLVVELVKEQYKTQGMLVEE